MSLCWNARIGMIPQSSDVVPRPFDQEPTMTPSTIDPSRELLFGLLALQNGLIDQNQLVAGFQAWRATRAVPSPII